MTISSFCRTQLRTRGPLPLETLTQLAVEAGSTTARNPIASVRSAIAHRAVLLDDGRWASPLWLLEGRVLTTPGLTQSWDEESWYDEDLPAPSCDLALLHRAARDADVPLADGGAIRCTYSDNGTPPGFPGSTRGPQELIGIRVRDGVLHTERVLLTPEVRKAGRVLADDVGALEERRPSYWMTGAHAVSDTLTDALWNRMAADPDFLTSPVPPLSQCIPALKQALRLDRDRWREESLHWRPPLDLPSGLRQVARRGAADEGMPVDEWLNDFVARSLREFRSGQDAAPYDEEPYDAAPGVLPFARRLRSL